MFLQAYCSVERGQTCQTADTSRAGKLEILLSSSGKLQEKDIKLILPFGLMQKNIMNYIPAN
jgi:invasion protein IalB